MLLYKWKLLPFKHSVSKPSTKISPTLGLFYFFYICYSFDMNKTEETENKVEEIIKDKAGERVNEGRKGGNPDITKTRNNKIQPSPKQRKLFRIWLKYMETPGEMPSYKDMLLEAGYSELVANTGKNRMEQPGFQHLLKQIDDNAIIEKWREWALDDDPKNRSNALKAGDKILQLKDRYPGEKKRVGHIHADLKDILE